MLKQTFFITLLSAVLTTVYAQETISQQEVIEAALYGKIATVETALKQGYKPDSRDPENRTALMYAAFNGHVEVAKQLIAAGADVNLQEKIGTSALMFAASGPSLETVQLLLDHGAEINMIDNNEHFTALMWAAAEGQPENVRLLLKHGADASLKDIDGDTAESFAAKAGHTAVTQILKDVTHKKPEKPKLCVTASGTGFFISPQGHLLTNSHVVNGSKNITCTYKNREFAASIIDEDVHNDIALLKIDTKENTPYLELNHISGTLGDQVFTLGFPNTIVQGYKVKYTEGTISSVAGINDDPRMYQVSVPIQPGNSGGPLISVDDGKVLGIISSKLSELYTLQQSGYIPQNVNYAVKGSYLKAFLSSVSNFKLPPTKEISESSVIDHAKESTIFIRADM